MQSMPYYQPGYQAVASYSSNGSYSNNGSPVPSSVMNTAIPSMMPHTSNLSSMTQNPLSETATSASPHPPKRKQVKNACTNCQKACKKCDDARPCPRCIKYGIAETCVNSVRKERKKGIKRGPYKRRQKDGEQSVSAGRKADSGASLMDTQGASQQSPFTAIRPPSVAFGYPSNLNQYGQPTYDPYGQYAAYQKDHMMPQSYVVNPVYSSMGYPMFLPNGGNTSSSTNGDSQQQSQPQQQASQQQVPQGSQSSSSAPQSPYQHSPVPQAHYNGLMQHQQSPRYGDHVIHPHQSQGAGSPAAHLYYQHQQQQHQQQHQQHQQQQHHQQQQQQQQAPRASPQLADTKIEHESTNFMKPQAMTPVPSHSTSSGASSPPEPTEDDEGSKYTRLSQLCSAALHHNTTNDQHSHTDSPNPQQQS